MTHSILLVGVGGQGTILAGKLLLHGLMAHGFDVKMSEIHGMSQRGGAVSTHIRYSREKVYSPVIEAGTADMLIAFEKMEAVRFLSYLRPGGSIVLSDEEIETAAMLSGGSVYPQNIEAALCAAADTLVLNVPALTAELGNPRVANTLLLGAAIKKLGLENAPWEDVFRAHIKVQLVEINLSAFRRGMAVTR